ncbi:MAG: DNA cytosine methyltransferase, partial [Gillisia sp.]
WKPVKEVLNLENTGKSIFERKKPLVENTLKRIYAGLVKFVANGDDSFIKKYFSGRPEGKVISLNGPAGTVTTFGSQGLVQCDFLQSYYGNGNAHSTDKPCPTVSTKDRFSKIKPEFLVDYQYKSNAHDLNGPAPTIVTKDKFARVAANFIDQQYGNSKPSGLHKPLGTITQNPKYAFVEAYNFLMNPQFGNVGNDIEKPAPTVIARQDKKPLGLIVCERGNGFVIPIYKEDTHTMVKIKQFMAYFGIVDIKMRMLEVEELLRIQGFPEGYKLVGNQTDKKKFIGNSVEVTTAKAIFEAHHNALEKYFEKRQLIAA